jgi:hypothetical protein
MEVVAGRLGSKETVPLEKQTPGRELVLQPIPEPGAEAAKMPIRYAALAGMEEVAA